MLSTWALVSAFKFRGGFLLPRSFSKTAKLATELTFFRLVLTVGTASAKSGNFVVVFSFWAPFLTFLWRLCTEVLGHSSFASNHWTGDTVLLSAFALVGSD